MKKKILAAKWPKEVPREAIHKKVFALWYWAAKLSDWRGTGGSFWPLVLLDVTSSRSQVLEKVCSLREPTRGACHTQEEKQPFLLQCHPNTFYRQSLTLCNFAKENKLFRVMLYFFQNGEWRVDLEMKMQWIDKQHNHTENHMSYSNEYVIYVPGIW